MHVDDVILCDRQKARKAARAGVIRQQYRTIGAKDNEDRLGRRELCSERLPGRRSQYPLVREAGGDLSIDCDRCPTRRELDPGGTWRDWRSNLDGHTQHLTGVDGVRVAETVP